MSMRLWTKVCEMQIGEGERRGCVFVSDISLASTGASDVPWDHYANAA